MNRCPVCFEEVFDGDECCTQIDVGGNIESLAVTLAGLPSNGKTTFIESLLAKLKVLEQRGGNFSLSPITDETAEILREVPAGSLPMGSSDIRQILLNIYGMPVPGTGGTERRLLYLYDTIGEYFQSLKDASDATKPLAFSDAIWLVYNIPRFLESPQESRQPPINEVFMSIVNQYRNMGESLHGKRLVIILTNGDRLLDYFRGVPQEELLVNYLDQDPDFGQDANRPASQVDLNSYMSGAERVSDALKDLIRKMEGGQNLISQANDLKIELRFCLVESIGHSVEAGQQQGARIPKRILDPLFWSLKKSGDQNGQGGRLRGTVNLIFDSHEKKLFEKKWLSKIWNSLRSKFEVNCYCLGKSKPVSSHPAEPPRTFDRAYPRILGPLIEDAADTDFFVIICENRTPIDLDDFARVPELQEQMMLAVTSDKLMEHWEETIVLRNDSDVESLSHRLISKRR